MPAHQRSPRRPLAVLGALFTALLLIISGCSAAAPAAGPAGTASSVASTPAPPPASTTSSAPASPNPATVPGPTQQPAPATVPPTAPSADPATAPPTEAGPLVLPAADPVSISIPAIGVTSSLSSLGRNPDGTVEVPSLDDPNAGAGWFRDSPEPGSLGPSVILGHVDSRAFGPGVFYDLRDLQPGDTVEVARSDGTVAVFTVDDVQTVPKATFPTQQVYGNIDHAGLRLITCGGSFDENARSYDDNIIAFASLVSSHPA